MEYQNILVREESSIGYITINRPDFRNALNLETLQEIEEALEAFRVNHDVRVIIFTGSGEKSFAAGADIRQLNARTMIEALQPNMTGTYRRIEEYEKPTIAAINGFALGGGLELALACDIRVAAENARFALPEVGLGIIPGGGGTQRLSRIIGVGRAKEMIFTCDQIDAQEAYRMGLANHVVPLPELMDYCMAMAKKIASKASYAVSVAKAAINTSENVDLPSGCAREQDLLGLLFATHDKKEGMTAFLERRKPNFKDF